MEKTQWKSRQPQNSISLFKNVYFAHSFAHRLHLMLPLQSFRWTAKTWRIGNGCINKSRMCDTASTESTLARSGLEYIFHHMYASPCHVRKIWATSIMEHVDNCVKVNLNLIPVQFSIYIFRVRNALGMSWAFRLDHIRMRVATMWS